jgi:site-specific recombinase XerD
MIEDMTMRKLSPGRQRSYVRSVKRFVHFFGRSPDMAQAEDLRRFQLHLAKEGVTSTSINQTLTGLRFFYTVTLSRPDNDSERMLIRVEQGKGSRDRHAMLSQNLLALDPLPSRLPVAT